jgi:hypothetical protein
MAAGNAEDDGDKLHMTANEEGDYGVDTDNDENEVNAEHTDKHVAFLCQAIAFCNNTEESKFFVAVAAAANKEVSDEARLYWVIHFIQTKISWVIHFMKKTILVPDVG